LYAHTLVVGNQASEACCVIRMLPFFHEAC
jgi:hypothetical protein